MTLLPVAEVSVRGKIRNEAQARQLRDFSGLRWGTITPTDIDACIDFGNKTFVFVEIKFDGKPLPCGQKLALERLIDNLSAERKNNEKKEAVLIVAAHQCPPEQIIDVASCRVVSSYRKGRWIENKDQLTVREFIDGFLTLGEN